MGFGTNLWRVTTFFINILYTLMALFFLYQSFGETNKQLYFMMFLQSMTLSKLSWDRWYLPENVEKGARSAWYLRR